jgi:hypothetical protein
MSGQLEKSKLRPTQPSLAGIELGKRYISMLIIHVLKKNYLNNKVNLGS